MGTKPEIFIGKQTKNKSKYHKNEIILKQNAITEDSTLQEFFQLKQDQAPTKCYKRKRIPTRAPNI